MRNKIIISAVVLVAICAGAFAWLFYAGVLFFNNPSLEKYPIRGVDVSNYQGVIDWSVIAKQDIHFAFIKATEGSSFVDPYFHENYENAAKTGIRVGAYHFFSFDSGGDTQAENFIREVSKIDNMLPPVIDIEFYDDKRSNPPDRETVTEQLNVFIKKIQEAYGVNPIIYAVYETYDLYIKDDFKDCDIWIRDVFRFPKLSDNRNWTFWQYTNRAKLNGYNGVEKHIDLNVFNGTKEQFNNYGKPQEPVWELFEQGKQYEIYYAANTFEYAYKVYDVQKIRVYESQSLDAYETDNHWRTLKIEYISDDIMKINASSKTHKNIARYFDATKGGNISEWFINPYMEFDEKVVCYNGTYLTISNMFYDSPTSDILQYRQFPCNFITTAAPFYIELSDDKTKLTITHLEKDKLTEVTQTFEIKVNSSYVSFFEKGKEFSIMHYIKARLPVVQGIGNAARIREINAEYAGIYKKALADVQEQYDMAVKANEFGTQYARYYNYDFDVIAQTENYISIKMCERGSGGGAHGWHLVWFDNYDIKTGKKLKPEDFLGDIPDWKEKLVIELNALNKKRTGYESEWDISILEGMDKFFFVENENLHILFNEYAIASYAAGRIEFALPISSLKN